jgi:REP element-mobilizing transposase RayT
MSSHLHLLCKGTNGFILSDIMRDFKKFTSKEIVKTIQNELESRREWMLEYFQKSCEHLKKEQKHKVWQGGYHAEIVQSNWFIKQKINYIHNNPVKEKIVALPEDYYFSSARNYAGLDYELEVIVFRFILVTNWSGHRMQFCAIHIREFYLYPSEPDRSDMH